MKPDFDGFEFAGLIAPGGVVVLALALLYGARTPTFDSLLGTVSLVTAAYVVGDLVAALGNVSEKGLGPLRLWPPDPGSLDEDAWIKKKYLVASQRERLKHFLRTKLGCNGLGDGDVERRMVVKQMQISVLGGAGGQRVESFNGLFNLSRGLTVSFFIVGVLCVFSGRYVAVLASAIACGLTRFRCGKFKDTYARELIQQFLSLGATEVEETRTYS